MDILCKLSLFTTGGAFKAAVAACIGFKPVFSIHCYGWCFQQVGRVFHVFHLFWGWNGGTGWNTLFKYGIDCLSRFLSVA
jgi:hypothetical protein